MYPGFALKVFVAPKVGNLPQKSASYEWGGEVDVQEEG
jgi:hypothetical protein